MRTITDEQLADYKEFLLTVSEDQSWARKQLAVVLRLQAAEKVASCYAEHGHDCQCAWSTDAVEAWRETRGL